MIKKYDENKTNFESAYLEKDRQIQLKFGIKSVPP